MSQSVRWNEKRKAALTLRHLRQSCVGNSSVIRKHTSATPPSRVTSSTLISSSEREREGEKKCFNAASELGVNLDKEHYFLCKSEVRPQRRLSHYLSCWMGGGWFSSPSAFTNTWGDAHTEAAYQEYQGNSSTPPPARVEMSQLSASPVIHLEEGAGSLPPHL